MFAHHTLQRWLTQVSRRDVLRCAAGLGVSFLLPSLGLRAAERRGADRPKSLITLYMAGGPSQLDLWDPHPQSTDSEQITEIKTTIADLKFSQLLPRSAEQIHHLNVIRSMVSKEGDHERGTYLMQTGYRPDPTVVHPALGAILSHQLENPGLEIPAHVSMNAGGGFEVPRGGYLGDQFDAFRVFDPGRNLTNLSKRVEDDRQQRRLEGLEVVSGAFRRQRPVQSARTLHEHVTSQALTMMNSQQLKAFEIEDEPQQVKEKYGNSNFGRGCLVARRLVETGVRAVQVVLGGFDSHANNFEVQKARANDLDPAFAALIADLVERDLLQSTVVLCIGEFGRTPWINPLGGRDHWPNGFSCVIGGGGLAAGQVIGATNPNIGATDDQQRAASKSMPDDPVQIPDLFATIMHVMGLSPEKEILTPIGRPIKLAEGTPLPRLVTTA